MGKKRPRQQSSNPIGESSESGDGLDVTEKANGPKINCSHIKKSVEINAVLKNFNSETFGTKPCGICEKEEKGVIKVIEETWLCLKCGYKTCSKEHSAEHFKVPRSDPHCICAKMPDNAIWCHSCGADIPFECNKRLKDCIVTLKRISEKTESKLQSKASQMGVIVEEKADAGTSAPSSPKTQKNLQKTPMKCHLPPSVKGLANLGNTCFFNSVLQCLAQTPHLGDVLKGMEISQSISLHLRNEVVDGVLEPCEGINVALRSTLEELSFGGSHYNPKNLLDLLRKKYSQFEGYEQHDAHELLRHLLESIRSEDLKRYRLILLKKMGLAAKSSRQNVSEEMTKKLKALNHEVCSIVDLVPEQVFKGLLVSEVVCKDCFTSSEQIETFLDLSLPIMSEKPQPPCVRRKGCSSASSGDDKVGRVSKYMSKKERRLAKKSYYKKPGANCKKDQTSPPDLNTSEVVERGLGSDVEGDIEDNEETDKRHESGYSSEKVSSSLRESPTGSCEGSGDSARASPASIVEALANLELNQEQPSGHDSDSSTKAMVSSPTPLYYNDNSYLCAGLPPSADVPFWPQYRISLSRHSDSGEEMTSFRSVGSQTLPFNDEGTPNFSKMLLRDPSLPDTTVIVRDSTAIMKSNPDWAVRMIPSETGPSKKYNGGLSDIEDVPEELPPLYSEVSFPPSYEEATSPHEDVALPSPPLVIALPSIPPAEVPSLLDEPPPPKFEEEEDDDGPLIGSLYDDPPADEVKGRRSPDLSEINESCDGGDDVRERHRYQAEEGECSVQSCLSQFTSIELMAGNNKVGCSNCTANKGNKDGKTVLTISTKRFLIANTPPVLILHLKRFQVQMYSFRKLTKHVCFPLELNIAPYCSTKALDECNKFELSLMYSLYGVVEHRGTLNAGHYVAYVKVEKEGDNRWFYISDSHVNEVTESRVLTSQAYLLFYKRTATPTHPPEVIEGT